MELEVNKTYQTTRRGIFAHRAKAEGALTVNLEYPHLLEKGEKITFTTETDDARWFHSSQRGQIAVLKTLTNECDFEEVKEENPPTD